jgi:hypothetical protein
LNAFKVVCLLVPDVDHDCVTAHLQVDRKNDYRQIDHLYFPHHEAPMLRPGFAGNPGDERNWCSTTLVDGELVLDKDKMTGQVSGVANSLDQFSIFSMIMSGRGSKR